MAHGKDSKPSEDAAAEDVKGGVMLGKVMGPCLMTALVMLIIGYFIGAHYPRVAKQMTAAVAG